MCVCVCLREYVVTKHNSILDLVHYGTIRSFVKDDVEIGESVQKLLKEIITGMRVVIEWDYARLQYNMAWRHIC